MPSQGAASFSEVCIGEHVSAGGLGTSEGGSWRYLFSLGCQEVLLLTFLMSRNSLNGRKVEKMRGAWKVREQGPLQWAGKPGKIRRGAQSNEPAVWEVWEAGTRG